MTQPRCSIIIRSYNEEKHIARLLEGIARQTVQDAEVILVDSGSSDRTVEIAQSYSVKLVHIAPEEFTFGRSLNRGIQAASGEILVFASAHVYPVYPDWLEKLLAPFAEAGVSMTRLESRPARTGTWAYYFYVDVEGHALDEKVARALEELKAACAFFKNLGSYPAEG